MSAQLFPSDPSPSRPEFTVLPPALPPVPEDADQTNRANRTAENSSSSSGTSSLPEPIQAILRNPIVLAGGAVFAGVVLSRFLGTASGRRIAGHLASEAMKHMKPVATTAAGMAGTAVAGSLLERGMEKVGPQITEYAKKMLADLLRKKE